MKIQLELSVDSLAGARVADALGADRIELCSAGALGGLTPSRALLDATLAGVRRAEVHVLVRPREGGFHYRADELTVMLADIGYAVAAGAAGVVVGALDPAGRVAESVVAELVAAAAGRPVTFHRAIDLCADPVGAVARLAELGVGRVLSSGQAVRAEDGRAVLAELVRVAEDTVTIMACGGVRAHNAGSVVKATGVRALHAAPRRMISGPPSSTVDYGGHAVFDQEAASALVAAVREFDQH